jgi:DNA-binding LytR/AlgR family response regulator
MQIAVCDDNELHLLEMKEKLSSLSMVENTLFFSDLRQFLSSVDGGNVYDAVLMDIDWGQDSTGMDAAAELYKRNPETKVIFVTGHSEEYSQQIFLHKANLSGFITKPVDIEILEANLQKVSEAVPYDRQPVLVVRQRGALISIPFREIFYIESWKHQITIYSSQEPVVSYELLDKITESLPAGFYQCHKSYVVNLGQIQRFQADEIVLKNGKAVPVSRSKYNDTKKAYLNYIGKTL